MDLSSHPRQAVLEAAYGFTADDHQANQLGQLSERQLGDLWTDAKRAVAPVGTLLGTASILGFALLSSEVGRRDLGAWVAMLASAAIVVAVGLGLWLASRRWLRLIDAGRVQSASGEVFIRDGGDHGTVTVGAGDEAIEFVLDEATRTVWREIDRATVHYTRSRRRPTLQSISIDRAPTEARGAAPPTLSPERFEQVQTALGFTEHDWRCNLRGEWSQEQRDRLRRRGWRWLPIVAGVGLSYVSLVAYGEGSGGRAGFDWGQAAIAFAAWGSVCVVGPLFLWWLRFRLALRRRPRVFIGGVRVLGGKDDVFVSIGRFSSRDTCRFTVSSAAAALLVDGEILRAHFDPHQRGKTRHDNGPPLSIGPPCDADATGAAALPTRVPQWPALWLTLPYVGFALLFAVAFLAETLA